MAEQDIAEQLLTLNEIKSNLKAVLINKGAVIEDDTPFSSYPDILANLPLGAVFDKVQEVSSDLSNIIDNLVGDVQDLTGSGGHYTGDVHIEESLLTLSESCYTTPIVTFSDSLDLENLTEDFYITEQ